VTGRWAKLHNDEFYNFYPSSAISMFGSRRMKWQGYVAYIGI
jgi:hypothetical protein